MTKKIIFMVMLVLCGHSMAASTFVCPNTFKTVMMGNTMDEVQAACGKPTSVSTSTNNVVEPLYEEQWIYALSKNSTAPASGTGVLQTPQIVITFQNTQVIEMVSNQGSVASLPCLRTNAIGVGSTADQVRATCGTPSYINQIQRASSKQVTSTQWMYNYGPYRPQMIFQFRDGVLQNIQMGQLGN